MRESASAGVVLVPGCGLHCSQQVQCAGSGGGKTSRRQDRLGEAPPIMDGLAGPAGSAIHRQHAVAAENRLPSHQPLLDPHAGAMDRSRDLVHSRRHVATKYNVGRTSAPLQTSGPQ